MTTQFDDLATDQQVIIEDTRLILGDISEERPWFPTGNEMYVTLLRTVVRELNTTQPFTNFTLESVPMSVLGDVLQIGLTVKAIEGRMNQWVEVPGLSGFSGPFADESGFLARWQSRLSELEPVWRKVKNSKKLAFLPAPAGTVGLMYPPFGGPHQPIPKIMRGLPSWYMRR